MSILIALPAFLVAIAVLVAVHEFGHFWVARKLGIKVLRFSIGFGKPLWRKQGNDDTEYVISAIPLGGYVKMLDGRDGDIDPAEAHRAFNRQPIANRIAVLVAGPLFNFIFAVFAYWLMFVVGVPGLKPVVGDVAPESPAAIAGLESEDRILTVGGEHVQNWDGAILGILDELIDDGRIPMRVRSVAGVERDVEIRVTGDLAKLTEPNALFPGLGLDVYRMRLPAVIGDVQTGKAASAAGLQAGDRIVSADDSAMADWSAWVQFIRARPDTTVKLEVDRGGSRIFIDLAIGNSVDQGKIIGLIGAGPQMPPDSVLEEYRAVKRFGPINAVTEAMGETWKMSALTVKMFGKMLAGDVSFKNITGPVRIAEFAGIAASSGIARFLSFLAIVSISLGILNLLPIPMLDGGQIVYQLVEGVKGSPVSPRVELFGQQIGIVLLLTLMGFAFYNDITHIFR